MNIFTMQKVTFYIGVFIASFACLSMVAGDEGKPGDLVLREVEIAFAAPDRGYGVWITGIRRVGDEIWVRGQVARFPGNPDRAWPQVITDVSAGLSIRLPDLPLKVIITGKSWNWANTEPYLFVDDLEAGEGKAVMGRFGSGEEWFSVEVLDG